MATQTVDPEILDAMILAEIAVKYECYSQAVEILSTLNKKHPRYLPAKETLQKIYRDTGKSEQVSQLENEMNEIRTELATDRIQQTEFSPIFTKGNSLPGSTQSFARFMTPGIIKMSWRFRPPAF